MLILLIIIQTVSLVPLTELLLQNVTVLMDIIAYHSLVLKVQSLNVISVPSDVPNVPLNLITVLNVLSTELVSQLVLVKMVCTKTKT